MNNRFSLSKPTIIRSTHDPLSCDDDCDDETGDEDSGDSVSIEDMTKNQLMDHVRCMIGTRFDLDKLNRDEPLQIEGFLDKSIIPFKFVDVTSGFTTSKL